MSSVTTAARRSIGYSVRQRIGLFGGAAVFAAMLLLDAPAGMSLPAWRTATCGVFMAVWWITEAVPIPVTALLPLVLFPLVGILDIGATAAPYANPIIFLFMGGFVLALAMQRHGLHRRVALGIVALIGVQPKRLILGVMLATGFISMWVSNTATAAMMLPIAVSLVQLVNGDDIEVTSDANFAIALMLGVAYGSSIGGLGTLIGTPPNALLAAFMQESYGFEVGFAQWMLVGVPLVVAALPLAWLLLVRFTFPVSLAELPGGRAAIGGERARLGRISWPERAIAVIFVLTALLWVFRPLLDDAVGGLSDAGIAIGAAVATFLVPMHGRDGGFVMDWRTAEKLPWGVLLLFGGGLSLAEAVTRTGLADWIGARLAAFGALPLPLVILLVTAAVIFLTELTSNTATAAAFLPLVASLAIGIGQHPLLLLAPATLAASCAFMLPVGTPPNAIVYGSGNVTIPQMSRAGVWLNLLMIVLLTLLAYTVVVYAFDISIGVIPNWVMSAS